MATTYPNGAIPASALDPVPAANGQTAWLLPIPAASFHAVRADCQRTHGWAPVLTSAGDGFRSYARQEAVFRQRYRPTPATVLQGGKRITDRRTWNGAYWWRFTGPAAAVPGTSNHGKGVTVDISGLRYNTQGWRDLAPILARHGWSNAEGASIAEPWHWNYTRTAYTVDNTNTLPGVTIPTLTGALPGTLTPEDDMFSDDDRARLERLENILSIKGRPYALPEATLAAVQEVQQTVNTIQGQGDAVLAYLRGPGDTTGDLATGNLDALIAIATATEARLIALQTAITTLDAGTTDPTAIRTAVEAALADFRASLQITVAPE